MKKQQIPACILLGISIVAAIGSVTFLGPCVHEDGTTGACTWAGRVLTGEGCLMAVFALIALLVSRARFGIYLGSAALSVLAILTPGTLIALCRMDSMRCRSVMQPAMILLFAAAGLAALAGAIFCGKKDGPRY